MRRARSVVAVLAAGAVALAASSAYAAPPPAAPEPPSAEVSVSREQFRAGMNAAEAGQWDAAREAFARAYALYPRPLTLLDLAGAQAHTGHLVDAAESYRRFLREATAPPASDHREDARRALEQIEPRIAHVRVVVTGLAPSDAVRLDGAPFPAAALGAPFPVDPGAHEVTVERESAPLHRASFEAGEGASQDVTLLVPEVRAAPAPAVEPPPAARAPSPFLQPVPAEAPKAEEGGHVWSSPWFWVIAGAVVTGGAVTGGVLAAHAGSSPAGYSGNVTPGHLVLP